jgi:hypothetical protein
MTHLGEVDECGLLEMFESQPRENMMNGYKKTARNIQYVPMYAPTQNSTIFQGPSRLT